MELNLDWFIINHAPYNAIWARKGVMVDLGDFADDGEGQGDVAIA